MKKTKSIFPNIKRVLMLSYKWAPFYTVTLLILNILWFLLPILQAKVTGDIINAIIDVLKTESPVRTIFVLIGVYVSVRLISDLISSIQSYVDKRWYNSISNEQELLHMESLGTLSPAYYEDSDFQSLIERVNRTGFWPILSLAYAQFTSVGTVAVFITTTIIMLKTNVYIVPILLISAGFNFYIQLRYGRNIWHIWNTEGENVKRFSHLKQHLNSKVGVIQNQLMQSVRYILNSARIILDIFNKEQTKQEFKRVTSSFFAHAAASLGFGISFYLIVLGVISGESDVGTLVFSLSILGQYVGNIDQFFKNLADQYKESLCVTDIFKIVDAAPFVKESPEPILLNLEIPPTIEFRDITFAYPHQPNKNIFQHFNLTIKSGEKIALVGNNGAGKTTLIKLLCRFYDPSEGQILINGIPLTEMSKNEWHSYLSLLFQDYVDYSFKVKESIAIGKSNAPINMNDVVVSSEHSGAHEFISKWDGSYDAQLGSEFGGLELSKGQEQKLAIARALYRGGHVLILDEPTASIDALSEAEIFEKIRQSTGDKTVIVISHRFNTVINLDRIVVIEKGAVVEEGTHSKLLKIKNGLYSKMFKSQAKGYGF